MTASALIAYGLSLIGAFGVGWIARGLWGLREINKMVAHWRALIRAVDDRLEKLGRAHEDQETQ